VVSVLTIVPFSESLFDKNEPPHKSKYKHDSAHFLMLLFTSLSRRRKMGDFSISSRFMLVIFPIIKFEYKELESPANSGEYVETSPFFCMVIIPSLLASGG
jgi:hypothetical protein